MARAVSVLWILSVIGLLSACDMPQDPTVIRIEEAAEPASSAPNVIPGPGATPSQSQSAEGQEAMGADTAAPVEPEEMAEKEVPIEKQEEKVEAPEEVKAPTDGTKAPVPNDPGPLTFKMGRDGGFDNTAAIVGTWIGERALICRVKNTSGALVTGTMVPSSGACFFDNNGEGYYATAYEFLAINSNSSERARWSFVSDLSLPSNAIATGTTNAGRASYACRVDFTDGSSIAGHYAPGYGGCVYSVNSDVYVTRGFYVLVK